MERSLRKWVISWKIFIARPFITQCHLLQVFPKKINYTEENQLCVSCENLNWEKTCGLTRASQVPTTASHWQSAAPFRETQVDTWTLHCGHSWTLGHWISDDSAPGDSITVATVTDTSTHWIQLAASALYLWLPSLIFRSFSITDKKIFGRNLWENYCNPNWACVEWGKNVYGVNKQPSASH